MDELTIIIEQIQKDFADKNKARDQALQRSRGLTRLCAQAIRATHRQEWGQAASKIAEAKDEAATLVADLEPFPDLVHSGYTQDALKEYVEANLAYALMRGQVLPTPEDLKVEAATYLGGLTEAATELRRRILDIIRHRHTDEAERLLDAMDAIYTELITVDFPDAITHGLRRRTDILRGVLERTRGDMTTSLRQQNLQEALRDLEHQLDARES